MPEAELLTIHTDGAARGNPGPAAYAYVIRRDGQPPVEEADCLGQTTNNQAEYTALVRALEHALELGRNFRLLVHSDSELMVKQLRGEYKVKNEDLRPLYERALDLSEQFAGGVQFVHVRREKNARADELCNEALDGVRTRSPRNQSPASGARQPPFEKAQKPAAEAPRSPEASVSARPPHAGLHAEAVECLRTAGVASPEVVWKQLAVLIEKHLLQQLRPPTSGS